MKIRFEVDQAEAFRRGVDAPKSIVTIEVDPSQLSEADRNLIADRLDGIDVCKLSVREGKAEKVYAADLRHIRMKTLLPTFEALMEAIKENEREVQEDLQKVPQDILEIGPVQKAQDDVLLTILASL
jgi:hypothetical protein